MSEGELLGDEEALRELALLYNHAPDDSRQFTRWQMVEAMNHGIRLATPTAPIGKEPSEDEIERVARAICMSVPERNFTYDELPDEVRELWRNYARAAITALRSGERG